VRRTRIVATIGPASQDAGVLAELIARGLDVARLNFSHGTREEHGAVVAALRRLAKTAGRHVAILQDLSGVKIRIGEIAAGSVDLTAGSSLTLTTRPVAGDAREISVQWADLPRVVKKGEPLFLADGELELEVVEVRGKDVLCRVVRGGTLTSRKGINLPATAIDAPALTEKDREDLAFGIAAGVDAVALSFVRTADNVAEARRFLSERGAADVPLIAKIEKNEAIRNLDAILAAADGIMVARGDLGIETPLEGVPILQKMLIAKSNRAGKPVITATQMLRSMVEDSRPTRAEVADVANAILDGTDAVMLSEESAVGRFPTEAVATMDRIAREVEQAFPYESWAARLETPAPCAIPQAVARAACRLAEDVGAAAIIACTQSGSTARLLARERPRQTIVALSPLPATCRRLSLVWGIRAVEAVLPESMDAIVAAVPGIARAAGLAKTGDVLVVTAGIPMGVPGSTNTIKAVAVP
jgi:pyruvate kinase